MGSPSLWMSVRAEWGVHLNGRELCCAEVAAREYAACSAFQAAKQFCSVLCTDPILPKEPVYGSNNWYYAYGFSSHEEILHDVDVLCEMIDEKEPNRPFMVIDDGWQALHDSNTCNGGPWDRGNAGFPDMPGLARQIKEHGCKPEFGCACCVRTTNRCRIRGVCRAGMSISIRRYRKCWITCGSRCPGIQGWGYQLLKHDFSTYDIFGKWGPEMGEELTNPGWTFADNTKTTAGNHFCSFIAPFMKLPTACIFWAATALAIWAPGSCTFSALATIRLVCTGNVPAASGVNTLAFRLAQNKAFFDVDADCVGRDGHNSVGEKPSVVEIGGDERNVAFCVGQTRSHDRKKKSARWPSIFPSMPSKRIPVSRSIGWIPVVLPSG